MCQRSNRLVSPLCRGEGENTALAFFGSFLLGKVLLHYRPHWCLVHSYGLLAFLTPFVFLLLHCLVTCRPFSVKLSPSGTGCLLLSSLLRLSSFRSAVRRFFVSDKFSYGLSFVGFPNFICIFVFMFQHLFCSLFSSSSSSSSSFCVCVCVMLFHFPEERPQISIMVLANPL